METTMTEWEALYRDISLARAFELATADMWAEGFISGEMHLGTGEEVITAAVMSQLDPADGVATDHRSSPPFVMRGVDLRSLFLEMLGHEEGLCRGRGGHMHFFSDAPLTVGSGIVGAAGPTAVGFALSRQRLHRSGVAVGFFGDGAANQGMLMESFNLAAAWRLPVVFVCKDNEWAITTPSDDVTGGSLRERAEAFGLRAFHVDGGDVEETMAASAEAIGYARRGEPAFLLAEVPRLHGHFLGYKAGRIADAPTSEEAIDQIRGSIRALSGKGGSIFSRAGGLMTQVKTLMQTRGERTGGRRDPVLRARKRVREFGVDVDAIDEWVAERVEDAATDALGRVGGGR